MLTRTASSNHSKNMRRARSTKCLAGTRLCHLSVCQNCLAVDEDVTDAGCILVRLLIGRFIAYRRIVEDDYIGGEALAQQSAITQIECLRRKTRHLAHSVFKRNQS